jgi:hypothetical protein
MAFTLRRGLALAGFNVQGDIGPYTVYTSRRGKFVVFDKAPPLTSASYAQLVQRNRWRGAAKLWRELLPNERARWEEASKKLRLMLTGYNLYVYFSTTNDLPTIRTIERQSGLDLVT